MYDNICKFIAENYVTDFATWLVGEPIPLTTLDPTELSLEPIRADSILFLQTQQFILHLEFQTKPDSEIPFRLADYRLRLYRRHPHKLVRQVVLYLRKSTSPLVYETSFSLPGLNYEFEVIRLWEQPTEQFMNVPGLLPFAVLSQTNQPQEVLQRIVQQVDRLPNMKSQSQLLAATGVLAGLVLSKEIINQVLRRDIMRESVIYQDILAEGRAEGRAEGQINEGRALVLRQLNRRVGKVPDEWVQRIEELCLSDLEQLGEDLLDFSSLNDLISWLNILL